MLYIASDHGGYRLKEQIKARLMRSQIPVRDLGPSRLNLRDDYPPIAAKVARTVARRPHNRGIVLCRSGVGVSIVANKIRGVRAVLAADAWLAKRARQDEDANVLCLPAEPLNARAAWPIVRAFLRTSFRNAARDRRRLRQIGDSERR